MRKLYQPDLPENQKRHIRQVLTDKTKIDRYKECLAAGEHKGAIVEGHLIPRSWLRKIDLDGKVIAFMTLPIALTQIPQLVGIWVFNTGSFTCKEHENLFRPVDDPGVDLSDLRNLNLSVYKAIIATLWRQKLIFRAYESMLAETPDDEVFQAYLNMYRQQAIGLEHYKREVERCLNPQNCRWCNGRECKIVAHKVLHIRGEPILAVSDFTSGIRTKVNPMRRTVDYIANWGLTVLPTEKGHTVALHYFREERDIVEPTVEQLSRLQGRQLQAMVSCLILDSLENIAISPAAWLKFGKRRQAMVDRFRSEIPDIGFGSAERIAKWERDRFDPHPTPPNRHQLNLFSTRKH